MITCDTRAHKQERAPSARNTEGAAAPAGQGDGYWPHLVDNTGSSRRRGGISRDMLSTPEIEPLFWRQGHGVEDGVLGEPTALAKDMRLLGLLPKQLPPPRRVPGLLAGPCLWLVPLALPEPHLLPRAPVSRTEALSPAY